MCIDWCILYSTVTVVLWVQYGSVVKYHGVGEEKRGGGGCFRTDLGMG